MRFSIAMPICNTKIEYVKQAVESCINQTYTDWELILIDDGSKEAYAKELDALSAIDERIHIFHKVNEGVSVARNTGVDKAKGNYVIFLDADDFFELTALSMLEADLIVYHHPDVLVFSLYRDYEHTCIPMASLYKNGDTFYSAEEISKVQTDVLMAPLDKNILVFPYCKCIKRELLKTIQPCFPAGVAMCEDVVFALKLFLMAKSTVYIEKHLYHYRQLSDSAVNKYREGAVDEQKMLLAKIDGIITTQGETEVLRRGYYYEAFYAMQRIIMMKFFHPKAPRSFIKRRMECGQVFRQKPYSDVFRHIDISILPRNHKIKAYMLKFHCYALMGFARAMYFKRGENKHID